MRNFQAGNQVILNFKKQHAVRTPGGLKNLKSKYKNKTNTHTQLLFRWLQVRELGDVPAILADYTFEIEFPH